jgi:2-phospho-L-lactate/phosphoenolpyruvate guanylyltransferase
VRGQPCDDRGATAAVVTRIVVPWSGPRGKTRLGDAELARAMLDHVLAAAGSVGRTWVVSPDPLTGAAWIRDPGGGQGPAVEAALREIGRGPVLIVNADLPSVTADDLRALSEAIPEHGIAIAPARDGTTNALGLSDTTLFAQLYGPNSAARFRAHAPRAVEVVRPGLRDDVDTRADLVAS